MKLEIEKASEFKHGVNALPAAAFSSTLPKARVDRIKGAIIERLGTVGLAPLRDYSFGSRGGAIAYASGQCEERREPVLIDDESLTVAGLPVLAIVVRSPATLNWQLKDQIEEIMRAEGVDPESLKFGTTSSSGSAIYRLVRVASILDKFREFGRRVVGLLN